MSATPTGLLPRPLRALQTGDGWPLGSVVGVEVKTDADSARPAVDRLRSELVALGRRCIENDRAAPSVRLVEETLGAGGREAYSLRVDGTGAEIRAASSAGIFYGATTLAQWIRRHAGRHDPVSARIPGLEVEDRPSFAQRGVLLDVSRNRVPTMDTLYRLVDRLAGWKINQLQLYIEHTFAYRGHEEVWRDASPLTGDEIRALDAYCRSRHVELVPNQQSFGHLHRWLAREPYRRLAECPEGVDHPFSTAREPFSLCATDPASRDFLADLYGQILPHFTSRLFNIGFDETFDLGKGRSAGACAERGRHDVYLDFLAQVRDLAAGHGRRIQFWADIVLADPELVTRIPEDAIALAWGYEADHPFAAQTATLAAAGLDFYVCPGTSSWNSFAGRGANALENLASAAVAGQEHGGAGYLVTDWGDNGHLQPLSASWLGFLAGAAFAWNADHAATWNDMQWSRALDAHAFSDLGADLGSTAMSLADSYLLTGASSKNGTALFHLVMSPRDTLAHPRYEGLRQDGLRAALATIENARHALDRAPGSDSEPVTRRELAWIAAALDLGARIGLARFAAGSSADLADLPSLTRRDLATRLDTLAADLAPLWLAGSRPGGLEDSRRRLLDLGSLLAGRPAVGA